VSSPEETKQAADLIERLLTDPAFRTEFRRDPISACESFGLTELAEELRGGGSAKALYTLELRQSMSSLAGVIMAAAAEGIGALELAGMGGATQDKRVAGVVNEALSRTSIKAISQAQLQAVEHQKEAPGDHEVHHDEPEHTANGSKDGTPGHEAHADEGSLVETPAVAAPPEPAKQEAPAPAPVEDKPAPPKPAPADAHADHDHAAGQHDHDHDQGPALADVGGPAVTPSAELAALLQNPNLELPPGARADLESGRVDPRLVSMLTSLTNEHKVSLSVIKTGHDQFTSGGSVSNHYLGRGIDIASVDGEIVRPNSIASRELAEAIAELPESIRPTEVGTPWSINAEGFFTDGAHQDHLHVAFDGEPPAEFQSPVTPAASAPAPGAARAGPAGASGVFQAATNGNEGAVPTVEGLPAVEQPQPAAPPPAEPAPAPVVPAEPAAASAGVPLPDVSDVYPGDDASKEQIAAWMARQAHKAGLPAELPIMAALVESRLSNIGYGHADSVGFFQMRTSIWDQGEYKGYGEKPELQLKWFIDHALHEKQKRVDRGDTAFLKDSSKWGEWIADVERPAEEYRGRYQEQLDEARELLGGAQTGAAAPAADATLDAATAGAELDAAPQAKKALAVAKEFMGTPYKWGGSTPETGFDCSGLMQWAYKEVGIEIPRVTYDQVNVGEKIADVDKLEAGDMVFFQDSSGDMHHVGMYIGDHKFIHAPHTGDVVKVSSLDEPYYKEQFAGGRRMVEAVPEAGASLAAAPGAAPVVAAPGAPVAPAPEAATGQSGVFATPGAAAPAGASPTVSDLPAVEPAPAPAGQPVQAAADVVAQAPAAGTGGPIAPVAPEDMANTNEGGKLHASEFHVQDAEGAPGAEGNLHAGYDLFAKAGAPVRSPIEGTIVEVKASRGSSGQVFGGTVKVQGADGRVWVFRHVDPKGVVEGGKVTAGQEIASVTEWTGGAHHAHIELWKTFEGGYNVSNMDDPYVELERAYAGGGAELPPDAHEHPPGEDPADHDHAGHDHGSEGELPEAAPTTTPSAELQALLDNPKLELPEGARSDLASGQVDPRMVSLLAALTKEHKVSLSVIKTGHDQFTSGGSVSNHFLGRGIDIASVDGEIVRPNSIASRELAEAIAELPESIRPTEVGTPWSINAEGFFTDGAHQDHLHVAFDGEPPAGFVSPVSATPAPTAAPEAPVTPTAAPTPEVAPQPEVAAPPEVEPGQSGVFSQVEEPAAATNSGNTVQFMEAVTPEVKETPQAAAPDPAAEPVKLEAQAAEAAAVVGGYPGDQAPKEQIAAWMATRARAAGIPPELPVMAALVESRLSNVDHGHADSIGFFQMRTSIWDQGEYAGYGSDPEKQMKWFIDHALHEKEKRVADGYTNFLTDETKWGDWIADVERPAEEYRGRYQERLAEARALLAKSGSS
jgi:cell wall-associated NlpC family hydrolase/murein DD-endopeptidase MepM/ murein hydrolase activator NlpD